MKALPVLIRSWLKMFFDHVEFSRRQARIRKEKLRVIQSETLEIRRLLSATSSPSSGSPVLTGIETSTLNYSQTASAVLVTQTLAVTDPVNSTMTSATVTISGGFQSSGDLLTFVNLGKISGSWDPASGVLTFTGTDSLSNYRTVLRDIHFSTTIVGSGARTISFQAVNGSELSNIQTRAIAVLPDSAPVLSSIEPTHLLYTQASAATPVTQSLAVTDAESSTLPSATIAVSSGYQTGFDTLSFTNTATITGAWNSKAGTLTLTGVDSVSNYRAAFRAVKFYTSSVGSGSRTISFQTTDGLLSSNLLTRDINLIPEAPPVLSAIEATALSYTQTAPISTITQSLAVTDADSSILQSATVVVSSGYQSGSDFLAFSNTSTITGAWNSTSGTLTLTGKDSLSNYRTALRSVGFYSVSTVAGVRTISFQVTDGIVSSNTVTRDVTVLPDNPPLLSGIEPTALSYTQTAPATPITQSIVVSDPETPVATEAVVQITSGYQPGADVLSFTNMPNISGTWNSTTGALVLSGTDLLTNYRLALRSISFYSSAAGSKRTISIQTSDGLLRSNIATRDINIANDNPPVISSIESTPLSIPYNSPSVLITQSAVVSDPENPTIPSATVSISQGYQKGADVLSFISTPTITGAWDSTTGVLTLTGSDTLANYSLALQSVAFHSSISQGGTIRTISFRATDGRVGFFDEHCPHPVAFGDRSYFLGISDRGRRPWLYQYQHNHRGVGCQFGNSDFDGRRFRFELSRRITRRQFPFVGRIRDASGFIPGHRWFALQPNRHAQYHHLQEQSTCAFRDRNCSVDVFSQFQREGDHADPRRDGS